MTWRSPYFDLRTDLFVPQLVAWDPETSEFTASRGEGIRDVGGGGESGKVSREAEHA